MLMVLDNDNYHNGLVVILYYYYMKMLKVMSTWVLDLVWLVHGSEWQIVE